MMSNEYSIDYHSRSIRIANVWREYDQVTQPHARLQKPKRIYLQKIRAEVKRKREAGEIIC